MLSSGPTSRPSTVPRRMSIAEAMTTKTKTRKRTTLSLTSTFPTIRSRLCRTIRWFGMLSMISMSMLMFPRKPNLPLPASDSSKSRRSPRRSPLQSPLQSPRQSPRRRTVNRTRKLTLPRNLPKNPPENPAATLSDLLLTSPLENRPILPPNTIRPEFQPKSPP